ncbi:MAG: hypothetical protein ABI273_14355 [Lacunisphaera sp.]
MKLPLKVSWPRFVVALAIGLAVWALRVAVVGDLGTSIPFWDQWDREGLVVYEPWLEGHLTWHAIFEPHLEHRIVWTHLWNLGLLTLCGQWDPMVQMVAQALFPALVAGCCVWGLLECRSDWVWRTVVIGGAVVTFGFPFADANILWGFQSQFELLVGLSFAVCAGASLAWKNSTWVWLTLLAGLAAPLAMGAGALAGPIILTTTALVMVADRSIARRSVEMITVGVACSIWGLFLRSGSTVMAYARAKSISMFLLVWMRTLAWPNYRIPWFAALSCLPVLLLVIQVVRGKKPRRSHELFLIGVTVWAIGCAAGGAWTRGGFDRFPPSRYFEFLSPLSWVNFLALVLIVEGAWKGASRRWRIAAGGLAIIWIGSTVAGDVNILRYFFRARRPAIQELAGQQFDAVNRVLSGAPISVMVQAGLHPSAINLERIMGSRVLAPILPPELQRPPANLTQGNVIAANLTGGPHGLHWLSGEFDVGMPAMIMFVRGEPAGTKFALLDRVSGTKESFKPSGRHIGDWAEWLVRSGRGLRQLSVKTDVATADITFVVPRPVSALGYWIRRASAQSIFWIGGAVICLAVALVAAPALVDEEAANDASH